MINTKKYRIFISELFYWDENSGEFCFVRPEFSLSIYKGKVCSTRWLYDWILCVGWVTIMRKAIIEDK